MTVVRLAGALLIGTALAWTHVASADPKRVALVDSTPDDGAVIRIRAELSAAGFAIVDLEAWPSAASADDVNELLEAAGAVAAVRVEEDGAEVWLVDLKKHQASLREIVRPEPDAVEDPTLAVRAVEVLRAEVSSASAPKRRKRAVVGTDPSAPRIAVPPVDERKQLSFDLGFGFSIAPGGVPIAPTFVAGGRWMPIEYVGAAFVAVPSPFHSTVKAIEGETSVWTGLAGAGLAVEPTPEKATWGVIIEAGLAGGWMHLEGDAALGFRSQSDTLAVAAPYLRPSLRWRLTPEVAVRLDALGAVAFPRPVVSFAGREVATWGRPVFVSSVSVELSP